MMIGGFTAVASTVGPWSRPHTLPAELRPLPPAVLVHVGHELDAMIAGPVGIAIPSFVEGRIEIDAVLASTAEEASDAIRRGYLAAVSIVARPCPPELVRHWRDVNRWSLLAVDLVTVPADRNALIDRVTYDGSMTEGQRRVRAAFDAHLAGLGPCQLDLSSRFDEVGIAAFDVLAPIVQPLRAEREETGRLPSRILVGS